MPDTSHNANLLRFTREPTISIEQAGRVHDLAKRILQDVGMEMRHSGALERLQAEGFRADGRRVFFEPAVVDEFVDQMRREIAARPATPPAPDEGRLFLGISSYSLHVHDIETDQVVPYTTERLIEMTKLVDTLADDGVSGTPPGIPTDVHPDLHPLAQYRIAAMYARQGAKPVDPTSSLTVNFLLDMAEVMERPIRSLPVYVPSPLRLGGESLDVVLAVVDHLSHISVSSMPSTGAAAPSPPFGALALAAAEVIGGMIAVRLLTGKPTTCRVGIFPFDLRAGAMVFGSPENMLFQMLCNDFNQFYGWPWSPAFGNTHVMSKLPDAQAAADKAAIMALGASLGARYFGAVGTLSLDDIFSPEQLLIDCEIRDWVQQAIRGVWLGEETVNDWLAEIQTGVQHGFIGLDSTLDYYQQGYTWYPKYFTRSAIGAWLAQSKPHLSGRVKDAVRRRIARHEFELTWNKRQELERIYQAAQNVVGQ